MPSNALAEEDVVWIASFQSFLQLVREAKKSFPKWTVTATTIRARGHCPLLAVYWHEFGSVVPPWYGNHMYMEAGRALGLSEKVTEAIQRVADGDYRHVKPKEFSRISRLRSLLIQALS